MRSSDTIYALSSGRPPAGVAVVRLSGPIAISTAERLARRTLPARTAILAPLRDERGELLDRALVLTFPAPASFTGEDVAELHVHGGAAVIAAVLGALDALGLRLAAPGEFSRRAFDHGKLDLTQAEGLADLIEAETEAQRRQALAQAGGRLRDRAEDWRLRLLAMRAEIESDLDFSDEADVPEGALDTSGLEGLITEIDDALDDGRAGERLREGLTIAVTGEPNVGKSSLINRIAGRDVSIVTEIPGTTRDVVEVHLNLGGVPVTLLDTAGLRESDDPIEAEGIRRARQRAAEADLVLAVIVTGDAVPESAGMVVVNKVDVTGLGGGVSAKTGAGIADLLTSLTSWAGEQGSKAEAALITHRRQREALTSCHNALVSAKGEFDPALRAEYLRAAGDALGRVTGRLAVEDMFDTLFARFCIGK